jgi:hypothetical protein
MDTQMNEVESKKAAGSRHTPIIAGIMLVLAGATFLAGQYVDIKIMTLALPMFGVLMLGAGVFRRSSGWMIPGGILTGVGLGVLLIEDTALDEDAVLLLTIAFGFALITVLSRLFAERALYWPLIPGSLMALVGVGFLLGGVWMQVLEVIGSLWPVGLIAVGVAIVAAAVLRKKAA